MPRQSSIDKLPSEVRMAIGRLRNDQGYTIDEIMAHLADKPSKISRSALGRHIKGLDAIGEKMRRSRVVAETLVRELGDAPESKAARLNIELMHSVIMDLNMKAAEGEMVDENGKAALAGDPEGIMMLCKALDHLARSSKSNIDFLQAAEARAERKAKAEAIEAVESVAKTAGLTAETVDAIKSKIFGVM
jgi:hypothetical protein